MKKVLSLLLVFGLAVGTASAQNATATSQAVSVEARVISPLTISVDNLTLDLGDLIPDGTTTTADPGAADAPHFTIEGESDATVQVNFSSSVTLSNGGGATMTFNVNLEGRDGTSGGMSTINDGGTAQLGDGDYHLYLGGSVTPSTNQDQGTYTGTFDVTATYTSV